MYNIKRTALSVILTLSLIAGLVPGMTLRTQAETIITDPNDPASSKFAVTTTVTSETSGVKTAVLDSEAGSDTWTDLYNEDGCLRIKALANGEPALHYRFASKDEGVSLLLANQEYYNGFSQNDLDFRMQENDSTMDEYLAFAREQVLDFTDEEKALIDEYFASMNETLQDNAYTLPAIDEIVLIKTTLKEEYGADAYTHGTQIFISAGLLDDAISGDEEAKEEALNYLDTIFWHELFHCLTRCNPEFRAKMYALIHFTIADEDFPLPPSVFEYHTSNPDVEHHDAYASFHINGQDIDCFVDSVTIKHFERTGESFLDFADTALIPVDGTDIYYTREQADNFYKVFGKNTAYVLDPEECMADNFSYALQYGMDGPDGNGYSTPEIIKGIISILKTGSAPDEPDDEETSKLFVANVDIISAPDHKVSTETIGVTRGTAVYDPELNKLTLDGFGYEGKGYVTEPILFRSASGSEIASGIHYEGKKPLVIEMKNDSSITQTGNDKGDSYGIYSHGSLIIEGEGSLTVTAGETDFDSYGIYVDGGDELTIADGKVTAAGGLAKGDPETFYGSDSFGIGAYNVELNITGGTVTATGGEATSYSKGISAESIIGDGITITGGSVTAESSAAGERSAGIESYTANGNGISITGGKVDARSGSSCESTGISGIGTGFGVSISNNAEVTAVGGISDTYSTGLYGSSVNGNSVVIKDRANVAAAAAAVAVDGFGSGIYGYNYNGVCVNIAGGTVTAVCGLETDADSEALGYGIAGHDEKEGVVVVIGENAGPVVAVGCTMAIRDSFTNKIKGKGWTDIDGTEGEQPIAVLENQELDDIKFAVFPEDYNPVKSVKLNKDKLDITVGNTAQLNAVIEPNNADKSVRWKSSNTDVVTVDENGNVKAVAAGKAVITVTAGNGKTAECSVTVTEESSDGGSESGGGSSSSSSTTETYADEIVAADNGTVAISTADAKVDDVVTIEATPAAGYQIARYIVTDEQGNKVVVNAKDGTFVQPDGKVKVEVVFAPIGGDIVIESAQPSPQTLTVDGVQQDVHAYNVNGSNFVQLRDLAAMLAGTDAKFNVAYDAAKNMVVITTGEAYTGTVSSDFTDLSDTAVPSPQSIMIDGRMVELSAVNIGGNNYFKLRDLAPFFGLKVNYDEPSNTAQVLSK